MLVSRNPDTDYERSRLLAALSAKERELDHERREGEQRRAELIEISTQLGAEQSRRTRLEKEIVKGGGTVEVDKADMNHKDMLITKLQRQVDEDQVVISRLNKERSPSVTRSGTPRLSPLAPPRSRNGSRNGSKSSEASLRMEITSLKQQLKDPQDETSELRKRVTTLQNQLSTQNAQANSDFLSLRRELDVSHQEKFRFQQQINHLNARRQPSTSALSDASSRASRVDQVELESLRKEVESLTKVRGDKLKQIEGLQTELYQERAKKSAPGIVKDCNHHYEINELKLTIASLQSEKQTLREKLSNASSPREVTSLKQTVAELQSEKQSLQNKLSSVSRDNNNSQQLNDLNKQIDDLKGEKSNLRSTVSSLQDQLRTANRENRETELNERIRLLETENSDMSSELHCLVQEMGEKRRMTKMVAEKASEFASTKKALMEQFESDKSEIASLKEEISRLSIELEVESTARSTSAQLVAVYSHKVGELLRDAARAAASSSSNAATSQFLEIINSHTPVFKQLESHCKDLKPIPMKHQYSV